MIINIANQEILIETKVYRSPCKFQKANPKQLTIAAVYPFPRASIWSIVWHIFPIPIL